MPASVVAVLGAAHPVDDGVEHTLVTRLQLLVRRLQLRHQLLQLLGAARQLAPEAAGAVDVRHVHRHRLVKTQRQRVEGDL